MWGDVYSDIVTALDQPFALAETASKHYKLWGGSLPQRCRYFASTLPVSGKERQSTAGRGSSG